MKRLGLVSAALILIGCAHTGEVDVATLASNSDEILWQAGEKAAEKHNWDSARKIYKRIIDGFPQGKYGPPARLALADSHFNEGGNANYILAISQYRDFLTLYPSDPKSAYAQFRVGEAFFKQKNSPDRDQAPTEKALEEFQRLLDLHPDSPFVETARERVKACRQNLAKHELQVGYFYQHSRKAWRSAITRYEGILKEYPDYDQLDEVLYRMATCLSSSGRTPEALPQLQKLLDTYPQSPFAGPARQLLQRLSTTPSPPTPGAAAKAKEIDGEVVSIDAGAKTITVKDDALGQEKTLSVEGEALTTLPAVTTGEKVKLTTTTSQGRESVTLIQKTATPPAPPSPRPSENP